jgi:para-aminobenzoate synthetase component 1
VPRRESFRLVGPLRSDFEKDEYAAAVSRVREHIFAGDLFQANLSRRVEGRFEGSLSTLYERLRVHNPAPFSAYLGFGRSAVLCTSPERFLRVEGARVETRPIKGTRPRTGDAAADAAAVCDLESSEKDRAELTMIVDVERNDLSRACRPGTVRVPRLAATEAYARVFHRVATVEGMLREGVGVVDLLRATFPGGSVTGAPKIRAMEILAGLERTARGPYTGAIGWIGSGGAADFAVAIRTLVARGERLAFRVGGGIVADSDPEAEWEETNAKARALEEALGAGGGS